MRTKIVSIPVVILKTKNGFNAFSPVIDGCAVTDRTLDRTLNRMKEALEYHLEGLQLIKAVSKLSIKNTLKKSFDEYGTDALYATLKIAA